MRTVRAVVAAGLVAAAAVAAGCGPPKSYAEPADVPKIPTLKKLMDTQATYADAQFKKIGAASYSDADFAAFADLGTRIEATSTHIKDFSMGPDFDKLADTLHAKAAELSSAAAAKDGAAARAALSGMKATCKECHSTWR
ncbi:MAG TPA: cytochrome c [Myxococcota bacterium]|jgi:cytochrome c556|nr:cytochrome c [Myxococcota bacterium]